MSQNFPLFLIVEIFLYAFFSSVRGKVDGHAFQQVMSPECYCITETRLLWFVSYVATPPPLLSQMFVAKGEQSKKNGSPRVHLHFFTFAKTTQVNSVVMASSSSVGAVPMLLLAAMLIPMISAQYQCTYTANINITAPDLAPAKFLVSAYDCCVACSDTAGCVASVYSNYYCHLKGSQSPQVVSTGPTLILQGGAPVPPTPPAPTAAPPTPAPVNPTPAPSVPTPAPPTPGPSTPSPPPPPTTPTPTPSGQVTIIREVTCQYSDSCSRRQDYSCKTAVYFNNTCQGSVNRICTGYYIDVNTYSELGCGGVVKHTAQEQENVCVMTPDETYLGHYCDVQAAPASGTSVVHTKCPYGCNDGSGCTTSTFATGVCASNPFASLSGSSVMAWCFPQYVVFVAYGSIDCSGPAAQAMSEPIGQSCFLDNNQEHIQNICS